MEIDGIPLTGKLSATDAMARLDDGKILLQWKVLHKKGKAKIWLATTNRFSTGGKDDYKLVTKVPVANGKATIDVTQQPADVYKIVIELPYNFLNRWVLVKK